MNAIVKNTVRIWHIEGVSFYQRNIQQIISQYIDNTLFTVRTKETSVDNLVRILHKFGIAFGLEVNWHKNVAYWCGRGTPTGWVQNYQWKWVAVEDLSKLLDTFWFIFGISEC